MARDYITVTAKEVIHRRVIEHAFNERERELNNETRAFVEEAVNLALGKNMALFHSCPKEWFPLRDRISVCDVYLNFEPLIHVPSIMTRGIEIQEAEREGVKAKAEELNVRRRKLSEERRERSSQIHAVLGKVRSWAQLEKAWPEVLPFARDLREKPVPNLPSNLSEMNTALQLPPKEKPGC